MCTFLVQPPPPLPRNPSRSAVDKHIAQKERRMSGTPQNAANGQPFRVVTPPAYEPLHFELGAGRQKGSEVGQTYSTVFMRDAMIMII